MVVDVTVLLDYTKSCFKW